MRKKIRVKLKNIKNVILLGNSSRHQCKNSTFYARHAHLCWPRFGFEKYTIMALSYKPFVSFGKSLDQSLLLRPSLCQPNHSPQK